MAALKQKYRIVFCSSEDPDFQVSQLLDPTVNSRGWSSGKFCLYPQEIILQFPQIVRLKQLQFLSHQCKISEQVEILVYDPKKDRLNKPNHPSQLPLSQIPFTKLGFLTFQDNQRSGYQARELKSVYVDSDAALVKLVFHQCHMNSLNLFNQVGIVALNVLGTEPSQKIDEDLRQSQLQYQPPPHTTLTPQPLLALKIASNSEMQIQNTGPALGDPEIQSRIRQYEIDKQMAVHNENFEQARNLKVQIDRIRAVAISLQNLDSQKAIAIQNDNFDEAKRLKVNMEQIKYMAMMHANSDGGFDFNLNSKFQADSALGNQMKQLGYGGQQSTIADRKGYGNNEILVEPIPLPLESIQFKKPFSAVNQSNIQSLEDLITRHDTASSSKLYLKPANQQYKTQQTSPKNLVSALELPKINTHNQEQIQLVKEWNKVKQTTVGLDDFQILPTHQFGQDRKKLDYYTDEYAQGEELNELYAAIGEPIGNDQLIELLPLIELLGEPSMRLVLSRSWTLREKGLNQIQDLIFSNIIEPNQAFIAGLNIVKLTVDDKIAAVCNTSMGLMCIVSRLKTSLTEIEDQQLLMDGEVILQILREKLGDNLLKIRTQAQETILAMCSHPTFGPKPCVYAILDSTTEMKIKGSRQINGNKHLVQRYQTLLKILTTYNLDQLTIQSCVYFSVRGIEHTVQEIRQVAIACLVELYKKGGEKIMPLSKMKPAQLKLLETALAAANIQLSSQTLSSPSRKKSVVEVVTNGVSLQTGSQVKQKSVQILPEESSNHKPVKSNLNQEQVREAFAGYESNETLVEGGEEFIIDESVCNFCGRQDFGFNQETIDLHYWNECPVLTRCIECDRVVEISQMSEHLTQECDVKMKYQIHDKCKLAIWERELSTHTCTKPRPAGAAKCILCTENVFPNTNAGWRQHLIMDGCKGNKRVMK